MSLAKMTTAAETSQLRVAILSDSEKQRANLKTLIEDSGMQVVENCMLNVDAIRALNTGNTDVLIVDLDDNIEHDVDFFDELLDAPVPTLFNDAASSRMRAAQKHGDWARNLTRKLADMVSASVENVVKQAAKQALEIKQEEPARLVELASRPKEASTSVVEAIPAAKPGPDAPAEADSKPAEHVASKPAPEPATTNDIKVEAEAEKRAAEQQAINEPDVSADYLAEATYLESIERQALKTAEEEAVEESVSAPKISSTAGIAARNVWVIGASIGGPQSVKRFLAAIQTRIPVAFVLAQHIGSNFVSLLAKQLDQATVLKVTAATEGHLLKHNEVIVAPTNERVTIDKQGYVRLKPIEFKTIYTPSIDTVMTDISIRYGARTSTIMFSGMGNDGVRGAQLVASRGGKVWAQDADSCVISSMPDSTRRAGVVDYNGSPEDLAKYLTTYFESNTM